MIDRTEARPDAYAYARADVIDDAAVHAAVDKLVATLGGIDILVNNAGVGAQGGVEDNGDAECGTTCSTAPSCVRPA